MIKTLDLKIIDASDWSQLVKETYNLPYNLRWQDDGIEGGIIILKVPTKGYDYDSTPENIDFNEGRGISFKSWLTHNPKEWEPDFSEIPFLERFGKYNFYPHLEILANDLYQKGLLPAGDYGINVGRKYFA